MPLAHDLDLAYHTSAETTELMDELCDVYADAYGAVPGEDTRVKSSAFRERASAALHGVNYSLVTARIGDQLVGLAFGYSLWPERGWWDGLQPPPPEGFTEETGSRTVVLPEIEVRRAWQGRGLGRTVHDAFLSRRAEARATLASNVHATGTHALYERWGWRKMGIVPDKPGAYYSEYARFVLPLPLTTAGR
ncbi:MAG: GNAT family N-acetyltransferase [Pseudonocardiaceae bacterium]